MAAPNAARTMFQAERKKAEARYRRLIDRVLRQVDQRLVNVTDPALISEAINQILLSPMFDDLCVEAARQAATMLAVGQMKTWRAAAAASSQGRRIYKALMQETTNTALGQTINSIVAENAKLIKTCPASIAEKLSKYAQERRFAGERPEAIMEQVMKEAPNLREFEARRIARTESSKASTALIQGRAEQLGEDFYRWSTTGGERVRPSHRIMEGVICRWSDPPNPEALAGEKRNYGSYHAGNIFNCRCIPEPIVALEDIKFPAKVHISGSIVKIESLKAFKERFGLA